MGYPIKEVDNHFYRSSRPTKDQLAQWKMSYDIGAVLNLEGDTPADVDIEKTNCYQLGIDESYLMLSGVYRPTANALREGVSYVQANQIANIPVLTHCLYGVNRTGMVCAAYRIMVQDWDIERAWQECLSYDFLKWVPLRWWKKTLYDLKEG